MIVYGYLIKSAYYSRFDIQIMDYMTTGELLFPIFDAVSLIFFFSVMMIPFLILKSIQDYVFPENKDNVGDLSSLRIFFDNLQNSILFRTSSFIYLVMWPIILLAFLRQSYFPIRDLSWLVYLLSVIWAIWMMAIIVVFWLKKAKVYFRAYIVLAIFLFSTILISYAQTVKSDRIYSGEKQAEISFVSAAGPFFTNDTLLFVGKTKDYVFLRDLFKEESIIHSMGSIDNLTIHWKDDTVNSQILVFRVEIGMSTL